MATKGSDCIQVTIDVTPKAAFDVNDVKNRCPCLAKADSQDINCWLLIVSLFGLQMGIRNGIEN